MKNELDLFVLTRTCLVITRFTTMRFYNTFVKKLGHSIILHVLGLEEKSKHITREKKCTSKVYNVAI